MIMGVSLTPQGAAAPGAPNDLRVGTDEKNLTPSLEPLAVGSVDALIIFPGRSDPHIDEYNPFEKAKKRYFTALCTAAAPVTKPRRQGLVLSHG